MNSFATTFEQFLRLKFTKSQEEEYEVIININKNKNIPKDIEEIEKNWI